MKSREIDKALERIENDGFNDNSGNGTDKAVAWATIAIATNLDRIADALEKLVSDPVVKNVTVNNSPATAPSSGAVAARRATPSKKPSEAEAQAGSSE